MIRVSKSIVGELPNRMEPLENAVPTAPLERVTDNQVPDTPLDAQPQLASDGADEAAVQDEAEFDLRADLAAKSADELKAYAQENDIDIGGATSQAGIYKKILAHLEAQHPEP